MRRQFLCSLALGFVCASSALAGPQFTLSQALSYRHVGQLTSAQSGAAIAWVQNVRGVRNIWVARAPDWLQRQVTRYAEDRGQEITQLEFSPDDGYLVYVVGGDHHGNWPAEGDLAPDPSNSADQPVASIWRVPTAGGVPRRIAEGDAPTISARGELAYTKNHQVWRAPLDGRGGPEQLFFDRGNDAGLTWSPDGNSLAFVSYRGDHAFIGIYQGRQQPLVYLAPSTDHDDSPVWSPDGARIAFIRRLGAGGAPEPILTRTPHAWSVWVADVRDGQGHPIWRSPDTLNGSYPEVEGGPNLHWVAGDRLVFLAYLDGWPHLYSLAISGGIPRLLTPGAFMVQHVAPSHDRRFVLYDANSGATPGDEDRRHLFRVSVERPEPVALTSGSQLEFSPVSADDNRVAYIGASARQPTGIRMMGLNGTSGRQPDAEDAPGSAPWGKFVVPQPVSFRSADGLLIHGQLFDRSDGGLVCGRKPAVIFVHGGPARQMLLGWHDFEYYDNAYAVNQYLAADGFIVLSVNYRLGIGYGREFHEPAHAGATGAAEYQDVIAAAQFLKMRADVDGNRIGIWGGSYGGYLTAMALARNSDIFKAGVDIHGVHDWTRMPGKLTTTPWRPYEQTDRDEALRVAWTSSPDAMLDAWKSPVLLIHGDDDRNVPFQQTVDLAYRLRQRQVSVEELVIPNEIHDFLRHASWLRVDETTVGFLERHLRPEESCGNSKSACRSYCR